MSSKDKPARRPLLALLRGLFARARVQRVLAAALLGPVLITSCAMEGYWIPPSGLATAQPGGGAEQLTAPAPSVDVAVTQAAAVQNLAPVETPAAPEPTDTPTEAPTAALPTSTLPPVNTAPFLYYVQAADTLPVVAVRFGVEPGEITSPDPLPAEAVLTPNQLLVIPRRLMNTTSSEHVIPDSEVVFSPSAVNFDIEEFVNQAGGELSTYSEWLKSTGMTSGANVVLRVAYENSINPRVLLSLLEYQSHWVYGQPETQNQADYPLGLVDPNQKGLYQQLIWAVNQLSTGYYSWREGRLTELKFKDGVTARLAPDLNAGSAALQYTFAKIYNTQEWLGVLDLESGYPALHARMFGSPWERAQAVEPLYPPGLVQPALILPFMRDWTWSYTGGPHGAWEHDGSYAAVDFAPGSTEAGCVPSNAWVTASSSGMVVRSERGVVVVDLDGDGYEQTGWVLVYLHVSTETSVPVGTFVDTGDPLGHPSCEGGFATGTHVHLARKYNGEWIAAGGPIPFDLGGWVAHAGDKAYAGTLTRGDQTVTACTCSSAATFLRRTGSDP